MEFVAFIALPVLLGGAIMAGLLILTKIMPGEPVKGDRTPVFAAESRGAEYEALSKRRKEVYRTGLLVLVFLAILTIVEYFAAFLGSTVIMFLFMLFKAATIMYFFMHITLVWRAEESH